LRRFELLGEPLHPIETRGDLVGIGQCAHPVSIRYRTLFVTSNNCRGSRFPCGVIGRQFRRAVAPRLFARYTALAMVVDSRRRGISHAPAVTAGTPAVTSGATVKVTHNREDKSKRRAA
jgi:hypothetical protein